MPDDAPSQYTREELAAGLDRAFLRLTIETPVSRHPFAAFICGQPGAGKSSTANIISANLPERPVRLDLDELMEYHPRYDRISEQYGADGSEHTHAFAKELYEGLFRTLSKKGYSLIIESTFKSADSVLTKNRQLKDLGYRTQLSVVAVDRKLSWQGVIDRAEGMRANGEIPRMVPRHIHDQTVDALPMNLHRAYTRHFRGGDPSGRFDNITVTDRQGHIHYDGSEEKYRDRDPGIRLNAKLNTDFPVDIVYQPEKARRIGGKNTDSFRFDIMDGNFRRVLGSREYRADTVNDGHALQETIMKDYGVSAATASWVLGTVRDRRAQYRAELAVKLSGQDRADAGNAAPYPPEGAMDTGTYDAPEP